LKKDSEYQPMSNYKFKTTNIRGKQYVEVNERIKFFRQEEQYKNWSISTEFPLLTADEALCRCTISDRDGMVIAMGHAHEWKASSNVNKTSYVENCETSAVGRALAMLGIGIDASIASANEVESAIEQQQEKPAAKKPAAKKEPAPKDEPVDDILDKAIQYVKSATDKQKAFDKIIDKYGDQMTDTQKTRLFKFVG